MAGTNKRSAVDTSLHQTELRRRELVHVYKSQDKVAVSVSPLYKPYFGSALTVSVNGIAIVIPCDGKTYMIPKTHAAEALGRIYKTDQIIEKKRRMKDVSSNFERNPGDLSFF